MPAPPVIINNTPLVALWSLDRLDLLRDLFGIVWLPTAVESEFLAVDNVARKRAITAVAPLLQQLLDQGLYFSPELISQTLILAQE